MKTRKLKKFVVPSIYLLAICVFGTSLYLVQRIVNKNTFTTDEQMEYVDKDIVSDNEYVPVVNEPVTIMRPYLTNNVTVAKTFYNKDSETNNQENSIIYYEGTYMQNSGTDYTLKEVFDVVSVLDGTVIEVSDNKVLGKTVKIKHSNELTSTYQSLSEVNVKKDDMIKRGELIGKSGTNAIYTKDYNLHFELCYQGKFIDPETSYNKSQDEL